MTFWVVLGAIAVAVILWLRGRWGADRPASLNSVQADAQARANALPAEAKVQIAQSARETALTNYDRNFTIAKNHGKDDSFAHMVGVLSAIKGVLAPDGIERPDLERAAQQESVPFNRAPTEEGRIAVAEYLVWKFFPDQASSALFAPTLQRFRAEIIADSKVQDDPDRDMFTMLYSRRSDWQRWLADHPDLRE